MVPKWRQAIQKRLDFNPLFFLGKDCKPTCKVCADSSPRKDEKRTKIAMYRVINYSFNNCIRAKFAITASRGNFRKQAFPDPVRYCHVMYKGDRIQSSNGFKYTIVYVGDNYVLVLGDGHKANDLLALHITTNPNELQDDNGVKMRRTTVG